MAILQTDLAFAEAEVTAPGSTNGGEMTNTLITSGQKNNTLENVSAEDRAAGLDTYVKLFAVAQSSDDTELVSPKFWIHKPTTGDDYAYLFAGTKTDTEATLTEGTKYITGTLQSNITAGDTSFTLTVENTSLTGIPTASMQVVISNKASPAAISGTAEFIQTNSTAPLVSGDNVTLYVDSPGVTGSFTAGTTYVSMIYPASNASCSTGTIVVTSSAGTVDEATYAPVVTNKGTLDEDVTVTFATATTVNISGSKSGTLATGASISADITMVNPNNSATLLSLPNGFFAGTWVALDTVVIPTVALSIPVWEKRIVPVACGDLDSNDITLGYKGESGA